jgi:hypothetical protein
MTSFRVVYSRGSFAFAITCGTREQALARALAISREPGVWHVHVEDDSGTRVILSEIAGELRGGVAAAVRPVSTRRKQEWRDLPEE